MNLTREDIKLLESMANMTIVANGRDCKFSKNDSHVLTGMVKKIEFKDANVGGRAFKGFSRIIGNVLRSSLEMTDSTTHAFDMILGLAVKKNWAGLHYSLVHQFACDDAAFLKLLSEQRKVEFMAKVVNTMGGVCKGRGAAVALDTLGKKLNRMDGNLQTLPIGARAIITGKLIPGINISRITIGHNPASVSLRARNRI